MNRKRHQKRYTTEQQILDEIDKAKESAARCLESALSHEAFIKNSREEILKLEKKCVLLKGKVLQEAHREIHGHTLAIEESRKEAVRLSKRRITLEQVTLPALSGTLAAFRTELLPCVTDDPAIVRQ